MFNIEKLTGRENFATWKFAAKTYLEHEDLWQCVEPAPNKTVDTTKDVKAKAKLILLLDPQLYVHVQSCETSKQVWNNLLKAFDDRGLTRKVGLLKDLVNTSLESCNGVEDYISKIMTTAHKLRNIGFTVNDEWLGTLMLAGLPDVYAPMIMGLESSGIEISADLVKTKLLQEIRTTDNSAAFFTNSKKTNNNQKPSKHKGPRCYKCNKYGHYAKFCKSAEKTHNKEHKNEESSNFVAAFSATVGEEKDKWYIDSGASMHMTSRKEWMYNVTAPSVNSITVANREPLPVEGVGCIDIHLAQGNKIQVKNVLYVPGLATNLLSVSAIVKCGYRVIFHDMGCDVQDTNGKYVCSATLKNKLYVLETINNCETAHLTSNCENIDSIVLWHLRMAHLHVSAVSRLPDCADGVTLTPASSNVTRCIHCCEGKQARLPFSNTGTRATQPLEVIHSDLCGPMECSSHAGMRYFITFIDDYTRMVHIYFMKDKLNVLEIFKDFKLKVENKLSHNIKTIRTDNGKEYCNVHFEKYLSDSGIVHQTSTPYTPQHNGMAERMNRTLVERARCMLFYADLNKPFWAEAIATAAYIVNRSPTKLLGCKTPYEMWTGKKPNLSHIRIFGSEAMVHIPKEKRRKWDKKSNRMILVGYCETSKGYRLFDPKSSKILISRDVIFFEKFQNNTPKASNTNLPLDNHSEESAVSSPSHSKSTTYSGIEEADEDNSSEYETDVGELDESYQPPKNISLSQTRCMTLRNRNKADKQVSESNMYCMFTEMSDPQSVAEALSSAHATQWRKAMDEEYSSLMENKTWTLTDLPPNKRALPSKWVFKTKSGHDGNVVRYKARLVIKGYIQRKGTDYEEIYSPVARYTTLRYLFALAARFNFDIDQMDAVSAFLQGEIDKEIYMEQPELYKQGSQVCYLHKSIYGLKQASRLWNTKLNKVLLEIGMLQCKTDPCVYYNMEKNTFIAVWVDDLILFTSQLSIKNKIKEQLKLNFVMKDLGSASQCVGLHIIRKDNAVMLNQKKYIEEILARFGMSDCKPAKTPVEVGLKFSEDDTICDHPYQQAIGSLLYVAQCTRPDISFAVNMLSRYNKEPKTGHWIAVKRVLRYLQGTKDLMLVYTKDGDGTVTGYCDADWASDMHDRKSCTGNVFMLQNGAISWCSRKQATVALSTAEAEYMSMSSATQEALWLQQLHAELGQQQASPIIINCDNQSAIKLANNDCYLPKTKHIDIRHHFLRDQVNKSKVKFNFCKGSEMIADILTKGTTLDKLLFCVSRMGLRSGVDVDNGTQPS